MSDDNYELERRMTQITARAGTEPKSELSSDDAELRMDWLALSDLLRRADAGATVPALRMPAEWTQPLRPKRAVATRHWAVAVMAAALVASLMAALTLPRDESAAAPNGSAVAHVKQPVEAPVVGAWEDTIDAEIESAGTAVREAHGTLALATASDQVQYQLEMLRMELDANAL